MDKLENQECPICHTKNLTLTEDEVDVPYFGKAYLFSMMCSSCKYNMSDVEAELEKESCRYTFEVSSEKDMTVRVVKSSQATIKIPQLRMKVEPVNGSPGYISNIEGVINRFEKIVEDQRDCSEDEDVKKSAKNLLKKIRKAKLGDISVKIIIEDPSGNSAIISDKAIVEKLKK